MTQPDERTPVITPLAATKALTRELASARAVVGVSNRLLAVLIFQIGFVSIAAAVYLVLTR